MYPLPSLARALVERAAITPAVAQRLADWQRRVEPTATPEATASLATIAAALRDLPRDQCMQVSVRRLVDDLLDDLGRGALTTLQTPLPCRRLQTYVDRLAALAVPAPTAA